MSRNYRKKKRGALKTVKWLSGILTLALSFTAWAASTQDDTTNPTEENSLVFYTALDSPLSDVLNERLSEACRRSKISCGVTVVESAARSLHLANQDGDGDAMRIARIKKIVPEATDNLLRIDESIIKIKFQVYSRDTSIDVDGWDTFKGKRTGFRRGAKILEKNVPDAPTILPSAKPLFLMLNEGRLDFVIEHRGYAEKVINELGLEGISSLKTPVVDLEGFPLLHKKHALLIPKIKESISSMKTDGTYQKIWLKNVGPTVAE